MGLHYNFPGANPGNAYAMIFVNTPDPTAPLTQAQIDKLAYADCAPGGMMMATCMTGTTISHSLRRHDPDQVRWVGRLRASQRDGLSTAHPMRLHFI